MKLLDANLLLYAYDTGSPFHGRAKRWLEELVSNAEPIGLPWVVILAFLRISTNPRTERPVSLSAAVQAMADWLALPSVSIVQPGERHWTILRNLLSAAQARGPLVMDAHLAALAIEHGAVLCTNDRDFARFKGLRLLNPVE